MKKGTETYSKSKQIFDSLAVKEEVVLNIQKDDIPLFRKHLSEMIKRQKSTKRYATRVIMNDKKLGFQFVVYRIN